jgi:integrase
MNLKRPQSMQRATGSEGVSGEHQQATRQRLAGPLPRRDRPGALKHFARKVDAQRWLDQVTASVLTGSYVDPKAGTIAFTSYFKRWSARQVWVTGTVEAMNLACGSTTFGHLPMRSIRRSHIETWVKHMAAGLAPTTVATRFNNVRTVFRAAKRDKVIGSDPTEGISLPRQRRAEAAMKIPSPEEVGKLLAAAETWFKPFIALCRIRRAATGRGRRRQTRRHRLPAPPAHSRPAAATGTEGCTGGQARVSTPEAQLRAGGRPT